MFANLWNYHNLCPQIKFVLVAIRIASNIGIWQGKVQYWNCIQSPIEAFFQISYCYTNAIV